MSFLLVKLVVVGEIQTKLNQHKTEQQKQLASAFLVIDQSKQKQKQENEGQETEDPHHSHLKEIVWIRSDDRSDNQKQIRVRVPRHKRNYAFNCSTFEKRIQKPKTYSDC